MCPERAAGRPIEPPGFGTLELVRSPAALCPENAHQPALRSASAQSAGPEVLCLGADPAALGLSLSSGWGRPRTEPQGTRLQGPGPVGGAASLQLQMISEVSGVGAPPGFHVWAPFGNLRARARDRTSAERPHFLCCLSPPLAVQGRRGEGGQWPRLLPRVL